MGHPRRFEDPSICVCRFTSADVHIICPRCGGPARVGPVPGASPFERHWPRRLTCRQCALAKDTEITLTGRRDHVDESSFETGLWLQQPCYGHTLWALNAAHLDFLQQYVNATLRERGAIPGTFSLAESLPAWIKHARHRDPVLRGIARLRDRLPR